MSEVLLEVKDLSVALQLLHSSDTLIDKLRQQITSEADKLSLGIIASEVYGDGVRIAYNTAINAFNKKTYYEWNCKPATSS